MLMFGDHAFFVWTSYALTAIVLAWQAFLPAARLRRVRAQLREEMRQHDTYS